MKNRIKKIIEMIKEFHMQVEACHKAMYAIEYLSEKKLRK